VHSAMVPHLPARNYLSFGSAAGAHRVASPTYMRIQTIGNKWEEGESDL
jgi:hypothetical protein